LEEAFATLIAARGWFQEDSATGQRRVSAKRKKSTDKIA
jgi:hypothetical protein